MKFSYLFLIFLFFLSCTENQSNDFETYQLESQEVMMIDTVFMVDSIGNPLDKIVQIDTVTVPIRDNINETWHFENQTLRISTQLSNNKTQDVIYQVEKTPEGFFLKRENESQFCKIVKKTNDELILETRGRIILKKINN